MSPIEPPAGLSPEASDLFLDVVEALGADMLPAQLAALTQAARLITQADSARDAIDGRWLVPGPRGVEVANPLLTVEQRAREGAARVLRSANLHLPPPDEDTSAGRGLARRRWQTKGR
jgi:hypothetical protein